MATATEILSAHPVKQRIDVEARMVFWNVTWDGFKAICDSLGHRPAVRVAYNGGILEFMGPSYTHEILARGLEFLVPEIAGVYGMPCRTAGSTLFRNEEMEKGKEPDACFYVRRYPQIQGRAVDPETDPAPDLAIEIEISTSCVAKLPIYAALNVLEVWRCDGHTLQFLSLEASGAYAEKATSDLFPGLRPEELMEWLDRSTTSDTIQWRSEVRQWILAVLGPRLRP